jgi:hypothetical protein
MMGVYEKLHNIQSKLHRVEKSGTNSFSKYSYSTLADMLIPLRPYLDNQKLTLHQSVEHISSEVKFSTESGGYYSLATVNCTTIITDIEDGSVVSVTTPGFSTDKNGDKAVYKAITGARKYGISCLFALEWFSVEPEDPEYDDKRFNQQQQHTPKRSTQEQPQKSRFTSM